MFSFKIQMYECKHSNFTFWNFKLFFKVCFFITMGSSNAEGLSQLYLELVDAYTKRFIPYNEQVAVLKCSPIWKKMRRSFKKLSELKSSSSFPKRSLDTGSYHYISWKRNPTLLMKKSSNREVWSTVVDSYFNTWDNYLDIYSNARRKTIVIELRGKIILERHNQDISLKIALTKQLFNYF